MPEETAPNTEPVLADNAPISVVKMAFAQPELSIYGLVAIFFNRVRYQVLRIDTVVNLEPRTFEIMPGLAWADFERAIIDILTRHRLNFRLTNEMRAKLEEHLNYRKFEEFALLLRRHDRDGVDLFLRTFFEKLYNLPGFRTVFDLEEIEEADFADRAPDEELVLVPTDESDLAPENPSSQYGTATGLLAPLFGVVVSELEIGDTIWVRPLDPENPGQKNMTREAVIRSLTQDDVTGFTIFAEIGPGQVVRLIETENVRYKARQPDRRGPVARVIGMLFNGWILLFFVLFALIFFLYS